MREPGRDVDPPMSADLSRDRARPTTPEINKINSLGIDVIRVLSILAVVIGHYIALSGQYDASGLPFPVQSYGVVTMFTISGFLITFSIYRKTSGLDDFGRYRFIDFLIDRGGRIFVVYAPVLVAVVIMNHYIAGRYGMVTVSSGPVNFIVNLLMLQLHPFIPADLGVRVDTMAPTWALVLEWWIYLFVGWVLLVIYPRIKRVGRRAGAYGDVKVWMVVVLGILSVYPLSRVIGTGTASSALAWFVGAAVFFLYDRVHVTSRTKWLYLWAGIVLCLICAYAIASHTDGYTVSAVYSLYSYLLTGAWFLCFLVFGRRCGEAGGRLVTVTSRSMKFMSGYMYSLFLTHYSVWIYLHHASPSFLADMSVAGRLVAEFVIANVVALAIGMLLERNGHRVSRAVRDRYEASPLAARLTL